MQRGGSAPEGPVVVFKLTHNAGFFSTFFFLCHAYIYAKENNYPFYIEHDNWQYTAEKGWHDYFTSLEIFPGQESVKGEIQRYMHNNVGNMSHYSISKYIEAIQAIFKPRAELVTRANGFLDPKKTPYTSLYVRRGDKIAPGTKEMDTLSITDILGKTDIKDDGRTLFVQTDDYSVVEEIRTLRPLSKVKTLTPESLRGSDIYSIRNFTPEQKRAHTEELIVSSLILVKGTPAWSDIRSNVGRFHKLFAWDAVKLYPSDTSSTKDTAVGPYSNL